MSRTGRAGLSHAGTQRAARRSPAGIGISWGGRRYVTFACATVTLLLVMAAVLLAAAFVVGFDSLPLRPSFGDLIRAAALVGAASALIGVLSWWAGRRVRHLVRTALRAQAALRRHERLRGEELANAWSHARDAEDRFRLAVGAMRGGVYRHDLASGRTERSDGMLDLVGASRDEDTSSSSWWLSRVVAEDRPRLEAELARTHATLAGDAGGADPGFEIEYRVRHADGRVLDVRQNSQVERDATGRVVRVVGTVVDVTDRKRLDQALADTDRRLAERAAELEAVYEALPIGLALLDETLKIRRHNATFLALEGASSPNGDTGTLPILAPRLRDAAQSVLSGGDAVRFEVSGSGDGDRLQVARAYPVTLGAKRAVGFVLEDATERRRTERLLRSRDERLRRLTESGIIGFMIVDGVVVREANDVMLSLMGRTRAELEAGTILWLEATAPEDRAHEAEALETLRREGSCPPYEKRLVRPDGARTPVLFGAALADPSEPSALVCFALDIAERQQREEHLRVVMREMSHRANNLLTNVQSIARQTLAGAKDLSGFETRFAERLQSLAESQRLLVGQDYRGASLADLVRAQLRLPVEMRTRAGDGSLPDGAREGSERIVLAGPPLFLKPEAAQHLGLTLHELATNARAYGALSQPDGRVEIEAALTAAESGPPRVRIRWREFGGPTVRAPSRRGFGSLVMERIVGSALDGRATLSYPPGGLVWELDVPAAHVLLANDAAVQMPAKPAAAPVLVAPA